MIFAADWWHGALVGQIVLSSFQILSALSIFSIARRWISKDVAWLATLILSDHSVDAANLTDRLRRRCPDVLSDLSHHVCAAGLADSGKSDPIVDHLLACWPGCNGIEVHRTDFGDPADRCRDRCSVPAVNQRTHRRLMMNRHCLLTDVGSHFPSGSRVQFRSRRDDRGHGC